MSAWRQAGLNYINYSNIAAKVLRRSLKPQLRTEALRRDESHVRITPWANGRPAHSQGLLSYLRQFLQAITLVPVLARLGGLVVLPETIPTSYNTCTHTCPFGAAQASK